MKKLAAIFLLYIFAGLTTTFAQTFTISGQVIDTKQQPLIGATVVVFPVADSTQKKGTVTDYDGNFSLENLENGNYQLRISYISYKTHTLNLLLDGNKNLNKITLEEDGNLLKNVTVTSQQIRVQQSGDTTSFNADAYKTNPDATAADLLKKMPGMTQENGTVKAGGEEVKRILVDGKPFFGDDPNATLSNLPAEIIAKIQVFDQLSEQAQLTGFDDGQSQKAINIITKPGKNTGQFGRIYAGYGTQNRKFTNGLYTTGGNINFFKGSRRISILGLSNNINQQNFSSDDLMGVMNSSGGGGQRGRGGRRGGGNAGDFLIGQQNGITQTHAVGINYSDEWGSKIKVSGSYFFNATENTLSNTISRTYFSESGTGLPYDETSRTITENINHRAQLRLEYQIDSAQTLIFTPRISAQQHTSNRNLFGRGSLSGLGGNSVTENNSRAENAGVNVQGDLVYRYKFKKKGRSASINLNSRYNNRKGNGSLYSYNEIADIDTTLLNQHYDLTSEGTTYAASINYTEPLSEKGILMFRYNPTINYSQSDKTTQNFNSQNGSYTDLDTLLSNVYDNRYITQRGGISYRYQHEKLNYSIGLNYQQAILKGSQNFPYAFQLEKDFTNFLPDAMLNYKFSKNENLRLMYRTNTQAPSIAQLQEVVDNSNPLLLRTGNPDLKQTYQHTLIARYGNTQSEKSHSFNAFLYANYTQNYIGTTTLMPGTDTVYVNNIPVAPGVQLSRPVNLDGYYNLRSFMSYGMPVRKIKSNLNLNAGVEYSRRPGMINTTLNYARTLGINGGFVISSNISEQTDFTISWSGNYNVVRNTMQKQSDNNYYSQTTSLQWNQTFAERFIFNTSLNHSLYTGLSQGFDQQFLLWNAYVGYKFLKDRSLEFRLAAYDILNQNRAISREVTETYIEDNYSQILRRYVMVQLYYTLRKFGGNSPDQQKDDKEIMPPPPPGGRPMMPGRPDGPPPQH